MGKTKQSKRRKVPSLAPSSSATSRKRPGKKPKTPQVGPRRKIETALVEGGYGYGTDQVSRVVDSLSLMRRAGQISERQYAAAAIYRNAHEAVEGGINSILDDSRIGGTPPNQRTPAMARLLAAETLREARHDLGKIDGQVVHLVIGEGKTIREAAALMYPGTRTYREIVGHRLRHSLDLLADRWVGRRKHRVVSAGTPDMRPVDFAASDIEQNAATPADYEMYGRKAQKGA
jgi:hypothetical protein